MPSEKFIEVRIKGSGMHPGSIRSKDLAEIIVAIEDMIASFVVQENPTLKKENIIIGLSQIENGSIGLQFEPNLADLTLPAVSIITTAINNNDFSHLPIGTINSLQEISKFSRKYDCETEFYTQNSKSKPIFLSAVTPETVIPFNAPLHGETIIYGEVQRAGGSDPKVQFRTIDGILLYCETTRELARQAGSHLYMQVGLFGKATWNSKTLDIETFYIEDIIEYEETSIIDAFAELRSIVGDEIDEIEDVESWTKSLRYDVGERE